MRGLLQLARPRQWIKNLLVFAAPVAAGVVFIPFVFRWSLLAFVSFCLASAAVYYCNDVLDAESDRRHPTKSARPIASGAVSQRTAIVVAGALALVALLLPAVLLNFQLLLVIGGYLVLQALYVTWLKHEAVFDIACVALGILLRAVAGGVASGLPISNAFLIVVGFGALFVATGKRYSEKQTHDQNESITRPVLAQYSANYLRILLAMCGSVTLVGYVLWAFEIGVGESVPFAQLSIIPFALALMRYGRDADLARVEAPESALFHDRAVLALAVIWLALFVGHVWVS